MLNSPLKKKLAEEARKANANFSLRQQDEAVSLDTEEVGSQNTRYGNITPLALAKHTSSAERQAMNYENSLAKMELDNQDKEELSKVENKIKENEKMKEGLIANPDNYMIDVDTKKKVLKPEILEQQRAIDADIISIANQAKENPALDKIIEKIKKLEDKYKWDGAKTDTSFLSNPLKWTDEAISNGFANTRNAIVSPDKYMTTKEKAEYNALKNQRDTFYKPLAQEKISYLDEKLNNVSAQLYQSSLPEEQQDKNSPNFSQKHKDLNDNSSVSDKIRLLGLKWGLSDSKREIEAYLNGEGGGDSFFRQLGEISVRKDNQGDFRMMNDMVTNLHNYVFKDELQKKADTEGYENLSEKDKQALEIYSTIDENQGFLADKQKWSYNTVQSTAHSLGFVRDIVIADALTGGLGNFIGITGETALGIGTAARYAGAGRKLAKGITYTADGAIKGTRLATSIGIENHLNPQYINDELMKGSYIERDETGEIKNIHVKQGYLNHMTKVYADTKEVYKKEKRLLETKDNLSPEEREKLQYLKIKLGEENSFSERSLDEELEQFKPLQGFDAELKGFGKMASERIAEVYAKDVFAGVGKLINKTPILGKYTTRAGQAIEGSTQAFKATKVGRIYDALSKNTRRILTDGQGNAVINGLPMEIGEEYFTAGLNSLQNRDAKEFIDQFDVQSNIDIAAQTLLMTSLMGGFGNVQTSSKLALNKLATKRMSELEGKIGELKNPENIKKTHADIEKRRTQALLANQDDTKVDKINKEFDAEKTEYVDKIASHEQKLKGLKENPAYFGAGLVKAISGSKDASFQSTRNYIDSRNKIRASIDKLRAATTDQEVNDVVNLMTATSGFSISDVKVKVEALKAKGKTKEAKVLEESMFQNLVANSFRGGVQDEFHDALKRLQKNTKLPAETRAIAAQAEANMEQLKEVYNRYSSKPNVNNIVNLAYEKMLLKQGQVEVEQDKVKIAPLVNDEIEAFKQVHGFTDVDSSLDTLMTREFEDSAKQDRYDEFVTALLENHNTIVDTYLGLENKKQTMKEQLSLSMLTMNEEITPSKETKNKEEFIKKIQEHYAKIEAGEVNSPKAVFNYNNVLENTPELIDDIFDTLKKESVGGIYEGKVSEATFEKMRNHFKNTILQKQLLEQLQKLQAEQTIINQKRKEEEAEVIPTAPVIVIDEEAENIFAEQLTNLADTFFNIQDGISVLPDDINDDEFNSQIGNTYTSEQLAFIKSSVKDTVNSIELKLGRKPSFREFMEQLYKYVKDDVKFEKMFNPTIKGWELNGYEPANYIEICEDLINPMKKYSENILNLFETEVVAPTGNEYTEHKQEVAKIETGISKQEAVITTYDEENLPVLTNATEHLEANRTLNIEPKLGFSAITFNYTTVNGVLVKETSGSTLNVDADSLIDFRPLLNPDTYKTGDKLKVEISDESQWSQIRVSDGLDEFGNPKTTPFSEWLRVRETGNPNFRNSVEFKNKVPIYYTSDAGKRLAYVQDVDWYNTYNVANPSGSSENPSAPSQEWINHINKGKQNAQKLRENIVKGLKEVTIQKPQNGVFYKIPMNQPTISIQESNPQATIVVQRGTKLHTTFNQEFDKGKIINHPVSNFEQFSSKGSNNTNGHTWYMVRIGFDTNDKGEEVETYEALPVIRVVKEHEIETTKWALAAHLVLKFGEKAKELQGTPYMLTVDQAKKIQRDINTHMGYNIESNLETINFIKSFYQTKQSGDSITSYINALFIAPNTHELVTQHTFLKSFEKTSGKERNIVSISKGIVTPLNQNYQEYLKSTLQTNIKSFDVDTTGKSPVYATVIQPVINVTYDEVTETISPRQEAINAVVEEIKQEQEAQLPFDITKHKVFLESIGVDIQDFEEGNAMIGNTQVLADMFKIAGNLNLLQEKAIRQFIIHSIASKVPIDYKARVSEEKIKVEIKQELGLILNRLEKQINAMLTEVNKQDNSTGKYTALLAAYNNTAQNIKDIMNNFDEIYSKGYKDIQKQTQLVSIEEKEEEDKQDDIELSAKDYNKDSIEESGKSKASYRLRRFLHHIPKYNSQGVPENDYLGLPSYMSFNDVYNELTKVLSMGTEIISDYGSVIDKLKNAESPFIKDILRKLDGADQQIRNEFIYNFVRHSLSSKFAMFELTGSGTSMKIYDTNANEAVRTITKAWKNENKASQLYTNVGLFNKSYAQELVNQFQEWGEDYTKVDEKILRNWLGQIGFSFQDKTWKEIYENGIYNSQKQYSFNELFTINKGGLFVPIVNYLTKEIARTEDIEYDGKTDIFADLGGVTKALSLIEAKNNPSLIALSFRDSGKNISTQVPTKFVTDRLQMLKRSLTDPNNTLIDDLQSLSFSESSIMLQLLKDIPNFKSIFEISHIGLTAAKEKGTNPSKAGITDLGEIDYDIAVMTGFSDRKMESIDAKVNGMSMRIANMLFPTMSDKTTGLYLKTGVFDFLKDSGIAFNINEDKEISFSDNLKDLLFEQLVAPELQRIIKFHQEVKATGIKNYDNGAMLFHLIPALNNVKDAQGTRLIEKLATLENYNLEDLFEITETFRTDIDQVVNDVVKREVEHKKELWSGLFDTNKQGVSTSKMFDKDYFKEVKKNQTTDYELGIYDFVLNSLIFNADVFKVFAGDIANYSQDKLYKESNKKVLPYQMQNDSSYVSLNKQIGVNLGKRLALLIAPGNKVADSYGEQYNQIFLEDSIDIAENARYLINNFYPENSAKANVLLDNYDKAKKIMDKHEEGIIFLTPDRYNIVRNTMVGVRQELAKMNPELDAYFDIESTDAQEYTTISEHLSLLHRMGRISATEFNSITNKLLSNTDLTKEELNIVFQPIKPVHTGSYINKDQDINRMVYIKSSAFPLIPQLTAGTKLDNLRKKMEELEDKTGRFTRASYQTANKVGSTTKAINPFDVNSLNDIKEYEANDVHSRVLVLNRNNFRIQQDVPFKSDKKGVDKVSMGTQFFKLLFGDGMFNIEDFKIDGKTMTGEQLFNHFNKAFTTIVESKKQELFLDLGLSEEGKIQNEVLFVKNLQDLLIKEATDRGYSVKSLAGLKIEQLQAAAGYYYDFKTPLWLSSDSNRYESLLNAIITNRIMKHKMPGNGFVAGAETGFGYKENLKGIDKSRIIYLDGWNGKELQGTHTTNNEGEVSFSKAQVFIPSKFKDNNGKLIDLFEDFTGKEGKYIIKKEDGSLTLKKGMIDSKLFNNFTFRTPTSSHVSGSSVEVVGILPPEVGDLMIVPRNFTKQKGLDYDIDKESSYALNHYLDKNGRIRVMDAKYAENKLNILQEIIDDITSDNLLLDKYGIRKRILEFKAKNKEEGKDGFFSEEDLIELLAPEQFEDSKKVSLVEKHKRLKLELDRKLAENEFIKTHLAVFNNPNKAVQSKINKVLSIEFAKNQASIIENLNEEGNKNKEIAKYIEEGMSPLDASKKYDQESQNFTMLTYSYQKEKMNLGSIGKLAIGVYANYTTFAGLIQQTKNADLFIQDENGSPKSFTIGKFTSTGNLGAEKTLDGERSMAEVYAEKENTATDNEKEQVLGRVGVNEFTINVDAHLTLRGFDKDENGNSISYMLFSQPIITKLNEIRKASKGILGEYQKDSDIINDLIKGLTGGTIVYMQNEEKTGYDFRDAASYLLYSNQDGELLTGENLLDGIKYNGEKANIQAAALMNYIELEKEAKAVSNIQKTINVNVLGKSMIESQIKYENLKNLPNNKVVANAEKLLGSFVLHPENTQGGQWIGDFYVTPNTPQGQIVINGLHLGNTIYKDFFPYQNQDILKVAKEILSIQGKEEVADSTLIDNFETIVENIKKYIYSRTGNNIFEGDARSKRYNLFVDDVNNTSLSTYLKNLFRNDDASFRKGIKVIKRNSLMRSFTYETGKKENELSLIKYNNAATDNMDEEDLYNSLPELVLMNEPLPNRNGEPYDTVKLAEDLVAYSFLEGGIQEATQFVKFVPVEFLESMGKMENGKFVPANKKLQGFNDKKNSRINIFGIALGTKEEEVSTFTRQYFQHNTDKAPKISYKDIKKGESGTFTYHKDGKSPIFVSMKVKEGNKSVYKVYENIGNGTYVALDTLGNMGVSEYEYRNEQVVSLKNNTLSATNNISATENNLPIKNIDINEKTTIQDLLSQISRLELDPKYAHLSEAAKWLMPMVKEKGKLVMNTRMKDIGLAMRESGDIHLNPKFTINLTTDSNERTALVFIHEFIHTITVNEILQYTNNEGTELKPNIKVPSYVTNLFIAYNEFVKIHKAEIDVLKEKIKNSKDSSYIGGIEYTEREQTIIYGGIDIFEFMTVSMTSPEFQKEMGEIPYKQSEKSIWDKIKEIYMDLITKLFPNVKANSLAESAILSSMDFIQEETNKRKVVEYQDMLPPDVQYQLDREEFDRISYQAIQESDPMNDVPDENSTNLMIGNTENITNFEDDNDPFNCK